MGRVAAKLGLVGGGVGLALLLGEVLLRLFGGELLPYHGQHSFELDPEVGFQDRPTMTLFRPLDELPPPGPGRPRVLFLGDSVTQRALIIKALERLQSPGAFEFVVAGVEGYNAAQSIQLFMRECPNLSLQHLVFSFHNNDFQENYVCYLQPGPSGGSRPLDLEAWHFSMPLFRLSFLYRLLLGQPGICTRDPVSPAEWRRSVSTVERLLSRLRDDLGQRGATLSVVLLPSFNQRPWTPPEEESYRRARELLGRLGLRTFDLRASFEEARRQRLPIQERPNDMLHPSPELAAHLAMDLHRRGLLTIAGARPGPDPVSGASGSPVRGETR